MELGFSKDGKLETFKDSDEFHVQIFLLSLIKGPFIIVHIVIAVT